MSLFGDNNLTAVDIGAGSVKVVTIRNGKKPKLLSAHLVELPLDAGSEKTVGSLPPGVKLKGKSVVTQVPGRHLTVRHLTLPRMPRKDLDEAVRWESKRFISYPLDAAVVEYLIVGEKLEGTIEKYDILMVAVPRTTVFEHLKPFTDAGVKVTAVDANALALRNVMLLGKQTGENVLVLDLGAGKTEINIFNDSDLRFSRSLETGGLDITRSIAQNLNIGLEDAEQKKKETDILSPHENDQAVPVLREKVDAIATEIQRSVEYYKTTFRVPKVDRMILTGGGSLMQGITDYLSRAFDGTVERDNSFERLTGRKKIKEQFEPIAPRFSAAVGLALRRS